MERATDASLRSAWSRGRAYRRMRVPRGSFFPGGFLPLLGLVALGVFGATSFATEWVEGATRSEIRGALDLEGHDWTILAVSGQQVRLSGTPPSDAAAEAALAVARRTRCPTWSGPRVCAIAVAGAFADVPPEPEVVEWPDLRAGIDSGVLTLEGQVPDEEARGEVITAAAVQARDGRITEVVDRLLVSGVSAPDEFSSLAGRVVRMAALCSSGGAAIENGVLSLACQVARADEAALRSLTEELGGGATLGEVRLVVAEEAAACEGDLAALLEEATIEFRSGSAELEQASGPLLDRIAEVARTCPGTLRIEGHTDDAGDADANLRLSQERAAAVLGALADRGVGEERMVAVGRGEENPIADNQTAQGRARNRRIEFRVILESVR